jgi:hypothetical protein
MTVSTTILPANHSTQFSEAFGFKDGVSRMKSQLNRGGSEDTLL